MARVVLRADGIMKRYPDGRGTRVVLDGVCLEVSAGQMVAVQGPSGCGKSTLLGIVAGLVRPERGTVDVEGSRFDFSRPSQIARLRQTHIGLVSQEYGLLDDDSVLENVVLPLRFVRPRRSRADRTVMAEHALEWAHVDVDPGRRVHDLSGGEKQRVAIARALVRTPSLLVADEPTAALDSVRAAQITARLRAVADDGVAVLVATHDPAVTESCDFVQRFDGSTLVPQLQQPGDVRSAPPKSGGSSV